MDKYFVGVLLVLSSLFWGGSSADAENIVFAVDTSESMGVKCHKEGTRPLDMAKKRINELLDQQRQSHNRFALIAFDEKAKVLVPFTTNPQDIRKQLTGLTPQGSGASIISALAAADGLFSSIENTTGAKVLLFSAGGKDRAGNLLASIGVFSAQGIRLNIYLADPFFAGNQSLLAQQKNSLLQIGRMGCQTVHGAAQHPDLNQIIEFLVAETGLPANKISAETDFVRDLGMDRLAAYETMAALCDKMQIAPPEDDHLTTVGKLAHYAEMAPMQAKIDSFTVNSGSPGGTARSRKVKKEVYEQEIFYGTNRQESGSTNPDEFYGGGRSKKGKVSYGTCKVTIPVNHQHGATESAFLGLKFLEDPKKHVVLKSVTPIGREQFFNALSAKLDPSADTDEWRNDMVVFVHGFNVKFMDAAKRTAQIAFDFGFTGLPVMFSWPSDGKLYGYMSDREDATWSVGHADKFLSDILDKVGAKRVHLVAHSMGNQVLIGALNRMATRRGKQKKPLFENIILAAPDFDAQLFEEQIAPQVVSLAKSWSVYTSDNDSALNFSTSVNSARRLGLPVTPIAGFDMIDATGVEVTPWSVPEFHSYYATKQNVVEDIISAIKGVPPNKRNLSAHFLDKTRFWKLLGAEN